MNKARVLTLVCLVFFAFLSAAFFWDSLHVTTSAKEDLQEADRELKKLEERMISNLSTLPLSTETLQAPLSRYKNAQNIPARHLAYTELVESSQKLLQVQPDISNPLIRRALDEISGSLNRRQIVLRHYEEAYIACKNIIGSLRGRVAKWLIETNDLCDS